MIDITNCITRLRFT
ncbi:hypothetical protein B5800_03975 [Gilliamella apicola]|nr:PTS transporter subunit EIIB [Gilliamella sp. W8145]ORF45746.1 hypothetical protein B5803_13195 [Gilliamella apicola]ORF46242.1 hypothetical protein B5800_03975 [Gilliamella apicola]ORF50159.1 hypothetical protein B5799_02010 [Gilliamella apicola]ORF51370.1 hypothetical protein B5798_13480 [Gilliamella apicola]